MDFLNHLPKCVYNTSSRLVSSKILFLFRESRILGKGKGHLDRLLQVVVDDGGGALRPELKHPGAEGAENLRQQKKTGIQQEKKVRLG